MKGRRLKHISMFQDIYIRGYNMLFQKLRGNCGKSSYEHSINIVQQF